MKTIFSIIKHELKTRVFTWLSLIFFIMLVFQGIWYTKGAFDYYVNDGVLMNAPAIIYQNYAGLGMLMVIIIAIVTGGVLYKDIQHKTAQWMYSMPVNEKQFFVGRYLAAFLYLMILGTGMFVGMLLVPYSGIGEAHRFGPVPIGQMFHAILFFYIPNVLVYVSLIFASIVFSKRMAVGYLASFVLVILFVVMQVSYEGGGGSLIYFYLDPSGYVSVENYMDYLTTAQKNTEYIKITGYVLANRLIWIGVALFLFILAYRKFSFKDFVNAGSSTKTKIKVIDAPNKAKSSILPKVNISQTFKDFVIKLFRLSKLELLNIVRPTSFKIILFVMILMILLQNLLFNTSYYIGNEMPLTSNMTFFRLPWGVFITMLLMIWSGELFFKEKTVKIWQITDALPVPVWVTQVSKLIATYALALILCLGFVVVGMFSQIIEGGFSLIDLKQYAIDILGFRLGFVNFVFQISLVFFIAGLTGNRFLTHILTVGYFLINIISFDMGLFEQIRHGYALVPGIEDFSEVSGYGILSKSAYWFAAMWALLATTFVLLGVLFWHRGVGKKWYRKLMGNQLSIGSKIATILFFAGFIGVQFYLNQQIYANGNFTLSEAQEALDADYEKNYKYIAKKSQPKYEKVDLIMDYYPDIRKVNYQVNIKLTNKNVDTLFLTFKDFITIHKIALNGKDLQKVSEDIDHHIIGYLVPKATQKDSLLTLNLQATKQYIGLSQSELQPDITKNGSFAPIKEFLPVIGYDSDIELTENRKRQDNGLEKLGSRMANTDDKKALSQNVYSPDANRLTGSIIISTSLEQTAIAPGEIVKSWKENERNFYKYVIDSLLPFNWCVGTANYNNYVQDNYGGIKYQIYADAKHHFNISFYQDAIKKSITYYQSVFQGFSPKELRFYEINKWNDEDFYAFANVIAISEKEGWFANTKYMAEKAYIYQTVAAQMAKLWLNNHMEIANVQGADMLRVAIPEALALSFVENALGKEAIEHIIKKKKDKYGKDRNNEPNVEQPLIYADGIEYLEANKGAIKLYNLSKEIGDDLFNKTIIEYLNANSNHLIVFEELYQQLLKTVPKVKKEAIKTTFETVE
ncbi:ABC-type transport system involved in multi-copper enzyme maturation permease subunit [Aquimarina sp. MAR_2010_214]|uniref:ABC transporter permease n=1 Tax=Aquimarina sp. MAR_2010_214 TaxID=1250026 RepID=UPI000C700726|nr:ABC transporter permease [Aquimarina sp. MAR_2010_214]PKV49237.1 ABC-type transport system involved in multi-copper enzyme maturation permease subunit [Aquimarina sp. MAR_2010_214]